MEFVLMLLEEEEQTRRLRLRKRRIQRSLRDNSDPFALPNATFKSLFRLPKQAVLELFAAIEPYVQATSHSTAIPVMLKVLTALHFYGQGSYQLSIGQSYSLGLSHRSVSRALTEITNVVNDHLLQEFIKFPVDDEQINRTKQSFAEKFNFPGVIGVIDGTLISISTPPINHHIHPAHLFIDRKGRHSLNMLIICDANLRILSMNARYPGSVHDAAVWMVCGVKQHLEEAYNREHPSSWLIGDSGHPNEPWLLTPVLNAPEDRYNTALRSARNCIERRIGILKGRFRCLLNERVLHYSPQMAGKIVNACGVLHNFLTIRNVPWEEPIEENEENEGDAAENENDQGAMLEGRRVRARVIRQYFS